MSFKYPSKQSLPVSPWSTHRKDKPFEFNKVGLKRMIKEMMTKD